MHTIEIVIRGPQGSGKSVAFAELIDMMESAGWRCDVDDDGESAYVTGPRWAYTVKSRTRAHVHTELAP